jgi:hypothetical protein
MQAEPPSNPLAPLSCLFITSSSKNLLMKNTMKLPAGDAACPHRAGKKGKRLGKGKPCPWE